MMCPKKCTFCFDSSHYSTLRVMPAFCIFTKTTCNLESCSSSVLPHTRTSSIWHTVPLYSGNAQEQKLLGEVVWRNSDQTELWKLFTMQQNLILASSLLKMCAPASIPSVCLTDCRMYFSWRTDLFNLERSTHILTAPDFFGTTTIPAHHSVGSSTPLITHNVSIQCSSSLTLSIRGSRILLLEFWVRMKLLLVSDWLHLAVVFSQTIAQYWVAQL